MNFLEAEEAIQAEDAALAEIRNNLRMRGREIVLHMIGHVQGSRLQPPARPAETDDGCLTANFSIRNTINELVRVTSAQDGSVRIQRGTFSDLGFHPQGEDIVADTLETSMKGLVRILSR